MAERSPSTPRTSRSRLAMGRLKLPEALVRSRDRERSEKTPDRTLSESSDWVSKPTLKVEVRAPAGASQAVPLMTPSILALLDTDRAVSKGRRGNWPASPNGSMVPAVTPACKASWSSPRPVRVLVSVRS
ncbi:hypothetical protein D3C80_1552800 [compost metagenome]